MSHAVLNIHSIVRLATTLTHLKRDLGPSSILCWHRNIQLNLIPTNGQHATSESIKLQQRQQSTRGDTPGGDFTKPSCYHRANTSKRETPTGHHQQLSTKPAMASHRISEPQLPSPHRKETPQHRQCNLSQRDSPTNRLRASYSLRHDGRRPRESRRNRAT